MFYTLGLPYQTYLLLQLQGAKVKVCGPTTLIPRYISSLGVEVETNLKKALEWCDVANVFTCTTRTNGY